MTWIWILIVILIVCSGHCSVWLLYLFHVIFIKINWDDVIALCQLKDITECYYLLEVWRLVSNVSRNKWSQNVMVWGKNHLFAHIFVSQEFGNGLTGSSCFGVCCAVVIRCWLWQWSANGLAGSRWLIHVIRNWSWWSESSSVVSNSLLPHGPYGSWNSPGQDTGVGSHFLLQGIFPTKVSNPSLLHCRQILYQLSHEGSPKILERVAYTFSNRSSWLWNQTGVSCIAGGFFTNWAMREVVSENHSWGSRELLHCSPSSAWWSQGSYLLYGVWVFLEQMFR